MAKLIVSVVLALCVAFVLSQEDENCQKNCDLIACGIPKCPDNMFAEGHPCFCCIACKTRIAIGETCTPNSRDTTCSPDGKCVDQGDGYKCVA